MSDVVESPERVALRERISLAVASAAIGQGYNSDKILAFSKEIEMFVLTGALAPEPKKMFEQQMIGEYPS